MSIFPVEKKTSVRYFKIQVDDICPLWGCDVKQGAILPTMGFTLTSPAEMDEAGGLPLDVGCVPESVIMTGDGSAFGAVTDHEMGNAVVQHHASKQAKPQFPYKIKNGDILECIWGKGHMKIQAAGQAIYEVNDEVIFPPTLEPSFAVFGLCGAVCRATLVQ